jgi:SAM-dependent methyltransferase
VTRFDNPVVVQWEYASEERLAARNAAYRTLIEGANAEEIAFDAVREVAPARLLDAGCGTGEWAERVTRELGAAVTAIDISPRMVELTRDRGVDASLGDVQQLPFEDASFDCAAANWMLYHVPDVRRAIAELERVLRPGGRLVAATFGDANLAELWQLVGMEPESGHSFSRSTGADLLSPPFASVECRDAIGTVVFPDHEAVRRYVAATMVRAHLATKVPGFDGPLRTRTVHSVFVAEKAP